MNKVPGIKKMLVPQNADQQLVRESDINLPFDFPRIPGSKPQYSTLYITFTSAVRKKASEFALKNGIDLPTLKTAIFALLMHRYSGDENLCFLSNSVVVRSFYQPDKNVKDFLFEVKTTMGGGPEVNTSACRVMLDLGGSKSHGTDLTCRISDVDGQIEFIYDSKLFESTTIQGLAKNFQTLFDSVVNSPEQKLVEYCLVSPEDELSIKNKTCAKPVEFEKCDAIFEFIEKQTDQTPDAIALEYETQTLTYRELDFKVNQLANFLRQKGVSRNNFVGILMDRSLEMYIAVVAALKAGAAYVPLDPEYPSERLAFLVSDIEPKCILTQSHMREKLSLTRAVAIYSIDTEWSKSIDKCSAEKLKCVNKPEDIAYMIYTSGSTGKPKGCPVPHKALANYLQWFKQNLPHTGTFKILQKAAFTFDTSVQEIFWPLVSGATMVIAKPDGQRDTKYLAELIRDKSVTHVEFVPSQLQVFLEEPATRECSTLAVVTVGGETLLPKIVDDFYKCLPNARMINFYGPTEATVGCTYWECDKNDVRTSIPIGHPISNNRVYILNEIGKIVPLGVFGELYVAGAQIADGYWKQPNLTAERFLKDPFSTDVDEKMYKTGDRARILNSGIIEFQGRADFQVKIRGNRVELGEIEVVMVTHPEINIAAVVAKRLHGDQGPQSLIAYFTLKNNGKAPTANDLRDYLRKKLPDYMVPAAFIQLSELPTNTSGKIDRKKLMALKDAALFETKEFVAPANDLEKSIAAVWQKVLKIPKIGRNDNFFELGGDSLAIIKVLHELQGINISIDLQDFYSHPILIDLADVVRKCRGSDFQSKFVVPPNLIPNNCKTILSEMLPLVKLSTDEINTIVDKIPRGASNVKDIYPLAPLQEGILYHHLMSSEGDTYLMRSHFVFDSRQRLEKYLDALQTVIDRHDILRTAVFWKGLAQPVQVVLRQAKLDIEEVKLKPTDGDVAKQMREKFDPRHYRLDIQHAPLIKTFISEDKQNGRWHLLMLDHHLISDHTTLDKINEEIQFLLLGKGETLPPPLPFRNLVAQAILGIENRAHEDFFKQMLQDVDEPTTPYGLQNVNGDGSGIEVVRVPVADDLSDRIRASARNLGVTPASLWHLVFARMLASISGKTDVVFGTVLFGRMNSLVGGDQVMGLFNNTLPIRIKIDDQNVPVSVKNIQTKFAELVHHEHASLAMAQRCSSVKLPAPLFSAILNYVHGLDFKLPTTPEGKKAWEGIELVSIEERTNYPLMVQVIDKGVGFEVETQVQTPIAPNLICQSMLEIMVNITEALGSNQNLSINNIRVLPTEELLKVQQFNGSAAEYEKIGGVQELFERQADRTPNSIALEFDGKSVTYRELDNRANQLAQYLRKLGVGRDVFVGLFMERSIEMFLGILGTLKAGGAYVPIDPEYPKDRIEFLVSEIEAPIILSLNRLAGVLPKVKTLCLDSDWQKSVAEMPIARLKCENTPNDLSYMIYTSGSTGQPKGCPNTHGGIANYLLWTKTKFPLTANDTLLHKTPFTFDVSVAEILWPLICGAKTVIAVPGGHRDSAYLVRTIKEKAITTTRFVPSMLQVLLEENGIRDCTSIRTIIVSGEALPIEVVKRYFDLLPSARLINLYGPTEAAVDVTCWECDPSDKRTVVPIGYPIPNNKTYILDDGGQPVPRGVFGELFIGGDQVARGYWKREELTTQRFLKDPFSEKANARMYRSGDRARFLEDGAIEYQGRADFQVKVRGFRIELGEIEAALLGQGKVGQVVVVAKKLHGDQGPSSIIAYFTCKDKGVNLESEVLRTYLASKLPEYMVPTAFVQIESIPVNTSGKADRKALMNRQDDLSLEKKVYEEPIDEIEKTIIATWEGVLKVEKIGRNDRFFELGGDSLSLIRVLQQLQKSKMQLELKDLYKQSSVSELANVVRDRRKTGHSVAKGLPALTKAKPGTEIPASSVQERFFFLYKLDPRSSGSNSFTLLDIGEAVNSKWLEQSVEALVKRYEIFRTTYREIEGRIVQIVASKEGVKFNIKATDLTAVADSDLMDRLWKSVNEQVKIPINLENEHPYKFHLFKLREERYALLNICHHIAEDGMMGHKLINELFQNYEHLKAGHPLLTPEPAFQYADYAIWEKENITEDYLSPQINYWKSRVANSPQLLQLPLDFPRPSVIGSNVRQEKLLLDFKTWMRAKEMFKKDSATPTIFGRAIFSLFLHRYSGDEELLVGSPIDMRQLHGIPDLMGPLLNNIVVRSHFSGHQPFQKYLQEMVQLSQEAYLNSDLSIEKIIEFSGAVRSLSYSPLYQAMFDVESANEMGNSLHQKQTNVHEIGGRAGAQDIDIYGRIVESNDSAVLIFTYNADLFESTTIRRMLESVKCLVSAVVANPLMEVGLLQIMSVHDQNNLSRHESVIDAFGKPVPTGVFGEICIEQKRTGRIGRMLANGRIEKRGRLDSQFKTLNTRIQPEEIEDAINSHPSIEASAVLLKKTPEGDKLIAYCVCGPDGQLPSSDEFRNFLKLKIPDFKVPVAYFKTDGLPLFADGSIDRGALFNRQDEIILKQKVYEAPRDAIEKKIVAVWEKLLKAGPISRNDNFFELGGNSLILIKTLFELQEANIILELKDLYTRGTAESLAEIVRTRKGTESEGRRTTMVVPTIARNDEIPASLFQERLYFAQKMDPTNSSSNSTELYELKGHVDRTNIVKGLEAIIKRHEIFRTQFKQIDNRVTQVIIPKSEIHLKVQSDDLRQLSGEKQEREMWSRAKKFGRRPFNLDKDLPFEFRFFELGNGRLALLSIFHHIIIDGYTLTTFWQEFELAYEEICANRFEESKEPQTQYADYAAWERKNFTDESIKSQLEYWRATLAGAPDLLHLPLDYQRPANMGSRFDVEKIELSSDSWQKLKGLAKTQETSLLIACAAVILIFLHRYSGDEDLCVGTPIDLRYAKGLPRLLGPLLTNLVVRSQYHADRTFLEFLGEQKTRIQEGVLNADVPFNKIVNVAKCARNTSFAPIYQVMFDLVEIEPAQDQSDGSEKKLKMLFLKESLGSQDMDIMARITDEGGVTSIEFRYNTDLFQGSTIQRMLSSFASLLDSVANSPGQKVGRLSLLSRDKEKEMLEGFKGTQAPIEVCNGIQEYFERQVDRTPDAVALEFENTKMSYRTLDERANQLSQYLRDKRLGPNIFAGILMERSFEMYISILAVLKAGGAYVPLDPEYPQERLDYIIQDIQAPVILTQARFKDRLGTSAEVLNVDDEWKAKVDKYSVNRPPCTNKHSDVIYMIYTSGSTGRPKGCQLTHGNIAYCMQWEKTKFPMANGDKYLQKTPFTFDVSVTEIFWTLFSGGTLVIAKPEGQRDPEYLIKMITEKSITHIGFVPSMLQVFLADENAKNCKSLKRVMAAGEALPAQVAKNLFRALPQVELINLYGPTETAATGCTFWECKSSDDSSIVPIGYPIPNTFAYILDDLGQPVPIGVVGELYIGGAQVGKGYWKQDDLTKERFLKDPFSKEHDARMYKTGDRARFLSNGAIEYQGRADFQVKIRGFRVELGEIEASIMGHSGVSQAVVVAKKLHGDDGAQSLVAFFIAKDKTSQVEITALREHLRKTLPEYMIPSALIPLEEMPVNASGKADRKLLMSRQDNIVVEQRVFEAPIDEVEKIIVAAWEKVLKVSPISRNDNFFSLGGDSLGLISVLHHFRTSNFGIDLKDLYKQSTVSDLAALIRQKRQTPEEEILNRIGALGIDPNNLDANMTIDELTKYVEEQEMLRSKKSEVA